MLDFTEINIDDKPLFDRHLELTNPEISEMTFTNFFMWRNFYGFKFTEICGLICILSVPQDGLPSAFMPIGKYSEDAVTEAVELLKEYFREKGWRLVFKKVGENEAGFLKRFAKPVDGMSFDRDNSDYLYSAADLINLSGKKFDGKRNHINRFKKEHEFEYIRLGMEHIDECDRIMRDWCAKRDCHEHGGLYCEKLANNELLKNYDRFNCKGAIIKVDGRFEAFTVGERLNRNTAVIHIEKAKSDINGLYTIVNQQFCKNEWSEMSFINREQDLGQEGLRKAKLSYNPVKIVNKYSIEID